MPVRIHRLIMVVGCALPLAAAAVEQPQTGFASSFAVMGGSAVTNSGPTIVTGNLGVTPGSSVTGFPPGTVTLGKTLKNDPIAQQARTDALAAYGDLAKRAPCAPVSLNGPMSLAPGVYCVATQVPLSGTVTLDAGGDSNSVWIFQSNGPFATAAQSSIVVVNGGCDGNVFWQVAGDATIGAASTFTGTILALGNITFNAGVSMSGRALALGQSSVVTLNGDNVKLCCSCPITITPSKLPDGKAGTDYPTQEFSASGGNGPYTFRIIGGATPNLVLALNGTLKGKPLTPGHYSFTVQATDSLGCSGAQSFSIDVVPCAVVVTPSASPPAPLVPFVLPQATVSVFYHQDFGANGAVPAIACKPTGPIPLLLSNCVMEGVPQTPGNFLFTVTVTDSTGCSASQVYSLTVKPACTITPPTLPDGAVCVSYSQQLVAPCGTFLLTGGSLPADLKLSPGGLIYGTPQTPEIRMFEVTATDGLTSASRVYTIEIRPLMFTPDVLPQGVIGRSYDNVTIAASPGISDYTFTITKGRLPHGLTLKTNGTICGTPNEPGLFMFTVAARNSQGCNGTQDYQISVCPDLVLQPPTLPPATAGVFYNHSVIATGGSGSYTYRVCSGMLPRGLALDPATGMISGKPLITPAVTALMINVPRVTICSTDNNAPAQCAPGSRTYSIAVSCPTLVISTSLSNGTAGTPYSQTITATGGSAPYTFAVASGTLPPGLSLAANGTLSGVPSTTGDFCFSVRVTDASDCPGTTRAYEVIINPGSCPPGTIITLSPAGFPPAKPGVPYGQTITPSGGTAPYTFGITSGALPPGLTLNTATGTVSGTPTTQGVFNFTLTVTDASGCIGTMGCSVAMIVDIPGVTLWEALLLIIVIGAIAIRRLGAE